MGIADEIINVIKVQNMNMTDTEKNTSKSVSDQSLERMMGLELNPQTLKEKFLLATFQIIAENGADSLSANELIKKTNSSKGALFHHFKTLDDLCLESLNYVRSHMRFGLLENDYPTLREFLLAYAQDTNERQASKAYFHIVHFFRDRALKDERFKVALNGVYENYINYFIGKATKYLGSNIDVSRVREVAVFVYLSLERMSFMKLTSDQPIQTQEIMNWFMQSIESKLLELKTSN